MTNLRTDEIVYFCNLTKIGTDENKAIYSIFCLYLSLYYRRTLENLNIYLKHLHMELLHMGV